MKNPPVEVKIVPGDVVPEENRPQNLHLSIITRTSDVMNNVDGICGGEGCRVTRYRILNQAKRLNVYSSMRQEEPKAVEVKIWRRDRWGRLRWPTMCFRVDGGWSWPWRGKINPSVEYASYTINVRVETPSDCTSWVANTEVHDDDWLLNGYNRKGINIRNGLCRKTSFNYDMIAPTAMSRK